MFKCLGISHFFLSRDCISLWQKRANLNVSWVQETRTYYFVKCRTKKKKLLLRAENLQRSDGCELTLSNVRLWISAKRHINHFQMVLPTTVRSGWYTLCSLCYLYKCLEYLSVYISTISGIFYTCVKIAEISSGHTWGQQCPPLAHIKQDNIESNFHKRQILQV